MSSNIIGQAISATKWTARRTRVSCRRLRKQKGGLPHAVIIGAQKAGTSFLFDALSTHPSIAASFVKETHFFDWEFSQGEAYYRAHFPAQDDRFLIEGTPYYLFHPLVPERVHEVLPGCRFICVLREPVARAYSQYLMERARGYENCTFEQAIERELASWQKWQSAVINGERFHWSHARHTYLHRGLYAEQLQRWFKHVGFDRILILGNAAMRRNPLKIFDSVCHFLGISPGMINLDEVRSVSTEGLPMEQATRRRLDDFFVDPNNKLEQLLGSLPDW